MIKKTVTYDDYNGIKRTEEHYFNLSKAEVMEMELSKDGGLAESIRRIVAAQDGPTIIKTFKEMVLKAYGKKSDDGRSFLKVDPVDGHRLSVDFEQTEAYSIIFMELATDADAAAEFVNGIMPKDMVPQNAQAKA